MFVPALQAIYHRACPRWVVTKNLYGLRCRVNINDHLQWPVLPEHKSVELATLNWVAREWGTVWDVGSNFDFYSLAAAKKGNRTVAFDMSSHAMALLEQSCRLNGVEVAGVQRAVTLCPRDYTAPKTGACTNRVAGKGGDSRSLSYLEAAEAWGVPDFIKMDIEGGEREFLESPQFTDWLAHNGITLCVELHDGYSIAEKTLPGMKIIPIDDSHCVIIPISRYDGVLPDPPRLSDQT
jgi:FkbM family methyltransferase